MVEHHLAKVRVAGSNPVVRSIETPCSAGGFVLLTWDFAIRRISAAGPACVSPCDPVTPRITTFCAQIVPGIVPTRIGGVIERRVELAPAVADWYDAGRSEALGWL